LISDLEIITFSFLFKSKMKALLLITLLVILSFNYSNAQYSLFIKDGSIKMQPLSEAELKKQLSNYDFSKLFTCTDNSVIYGFIGNDHQRIRIKFISVTKDSSALNTYKVYGKSMVKNNVDEFNGSIVISNISKQKVMSYGVDDEYKNKGFKGEYVISGSYSFLEKPEQNHTRTFNGTFRTGYYLDRKYNVHYDDINNYSDGYTNNLFSGKWKSHNGKIVQICNWGDYRIPNSGNFDVGAAEFSPNTGDTTLGWQSIHDMWIRDKNGKLTAKAKQAKRIEETKWWQ